jgi:hypothetical protein
MPILFDSQKTNSRLHGKMALVLPKTAVSIVKKTRNNRRTKFARKAQKPNANPRSTLLDIGESSIGDV